MITRHATNVVKVLIVLSVASAFSAASIQITDPQEQEVVNAGASPRGGFSG